MFTKADILTRLQNGETADALADEFVTALNAAEDEMRATEAQHAEEYRVYAAKREAVSMVIDGFCDYLVASGEDELLAEMQNVDPDKMVEMFDGMIELAKSFEKLKDLEFPKATSNDGWVKLFAGMF